MVAFVLLGLLGCALALFVWLDEELNPEVIDD
jgi:hypothetical protein